LCCGGRTPLPASAVRGRATTTSGSSRRFSSTGRPDGSPASGDGAARGPESQPRRDETFRRLLTRPMAGHRGNERLTLDRREPRVRERDGARGSRNGTKEPDLAEGRPGVEYTDASAVDVDRDTAVLDDVEAIAG